MQSKEIVTLIIAIIGMALGIANFIIERMRSREKLKVIPKAVKDKFITTETQTEGFILSKDQYYPNNNSGLFAIEIINLSSFRVKITGVGFLAKGEPDRMVISVPITYNELKFPFSLDSRDSATVYCLESNVSSRATKIVCAYVETATDKVHKGTSKALADLIQFHRNIH